MSKTLLTLLIFILILVLFSTNVMALYWGKSTYTCNKDIQEVNLNQPMEGCMEGKKAYWTFIIGTTKDDSIQEQIRGIWIVDSDGNTMAINRSVPAIRLKKNLEPFVYATLEGLLPAPTRGNTLIYTVCFEYNAYDEFLEEYTWFDTCSEDTVSLFMNYLINLKCQTSEDCEYNEYCQDSKCKLLNCDSCEYIETHQCKTYECCDASSCNDNQKCETNKCVNLECKEEEFIEDNQCKPLNCKETQIVLNHECVNLECRFMEKPLNHECKKNKFIITLISTIFFILIISITLILYKIKSKKDTKIRKRK